MEENILLDEGVLVKDTLSRHVNNRYLENTYAHPCMINVVTLFLDRDGRFLILFLFGFCYVLLVGL